MSILTHDEAKRLSQSSTDPLEVIRNVEAAVIIKLAGSQNAPKDEIRLIWKPKCDALRQQLEVESKAAAHWMEEANMEHNKNVRLSQQLEAVTSDRDSLHKDAESIAESRLLRIEELENEIKAWALTVDNLEAKLCLNAPQIVT